MVDTKLNVWLLEVNSSPSMEFSTPITEKLVTLMMPQMLRIILEHNHGRDGQTVEDFELIYN